MTCPYCKSDNWVCNTHKKSVTEPIDEGFIEYSFAYCPDCGKEFVSKDVYEIVEMGTLMTMEEYEESE